MNLSTNILSIRKHSSKCVGINSELRRNWLKQFSPLEALKYVRGGKAAPSAGGRLLKAAMH